MTHNPKPTSDDTSGRFAYDGLERVFHEKAHLGNHDFTRDQP